MSSNSKMQSMIDDRVKIKTYERDGDEEVSRDNIDRQSIRERNGLEEEGGTFNDGQQDEEENEIGDGDEQERGEEEIADDE